jgi:hypothetical protein
MRHFPGLLLAHRHLVAAGSLCVLLLAPVAMAQAGMTLGLQFVANNDGSCGSSTDLGVPTYYTGGIYSLAVSVLSGDSSNPRLPYKGITDWTWPAGLSLSVGWAPTAYSALHPSAALRKQLQLEYTVTWSQIRDDSLWRATGRTPILQLPPASEFSFRIPEIAADSFLCFFAEWDHPQYGHLIAEAITCARILPPSSDAAQDVIRRTYVYNEYQQNHYDQAIAFADSFVALGWHDLNGLVCAGMCARDAGRYDDAIRFLDLCYQWHHRITLPMDEDEGDGASPETAAGRDRYEHFRSELIEMKNQQQQH